MYWRRFYAEKMWGYLLSGAIEMALPMVRAQRRGGNARQSSRAVPEKLFGPAADDPERNRTWWEKPGLGLMFQIEARPGWQWQRNFDRFNDSMKGPDGSLAFDGPTPRMQEWVEFSRAVGVDYHMFEAKWHDGICYWDSRLTNWKTPTDYCRSFADESRRAGIPFGFYYSAVFDHNPEFDDIQPLRRSTPSYPAARGGPTAAVKKSLRFTQFARLLIALRRRQRQRRGASTEVPLPWFDDFGFNEFEYDPDRYIRYVLDQLEELCGEYGAEVIWVDWYDGSGDGCSEEIMDFMREQHPEVALAYNNSIMEDLPWAHYVSFEAHGIQQTWRQAKTYRSWKRPWELVSPAARDWDAPQPKRNELENTLTAALIMAAGGKVNFGIASEMDGSLHPGVVKQMETLGQWYRPRRDLFVEGRPVRDREVLKGVRPQNRGIKLLATQQRGDRLLHVFDLGAGSSPQEPVTIDLEGPEWTGGQRVVLEPSLDELTLERTGNSWRLVIPPHARDAVDTILRFRRG